MMFALEYSREARNFLKKLDKSLSKRIVDKIKLLESDPVPHGSVRIVGEERTFRIRVGDYRILYKILWNDNLILVSKIDKRSRVYEEEE